jgi:hypothetical protein
MPADAVDDFAKGCILEHDARVLGPWASEVEGARLHGIAGGGGNGGIIYDVAV